MACLLNKFLWWHFLPKLQMLRKLNELGVATSEDTNYSIGGAYEIPVTNRLDIIPRGYKQRSSTGELKATNTKQRTELYCAESHILRLGIIWKEDFFIGSKYGRSFINKDSIDNEDIYSVNAEYVVNSALGDWNRSVMDKPRISNKLLYKSILLI